MPVSLASDYREAAITLAVSPKASAALSRRCLQNTIREKLGIKKATLEQEIEEAMKVVSSGLGQQLHAVRQIGNFAAHPTKDTNTGDIVDVEPDEAEWNLDVLDTMFDELYVVPARAAARTANLNQKLKDAGKPPI